VIDTNHGNIDIWDQKETKNDFNIPNKRVDKEYKYFSNTDSNYQIDQK